MRGVKAEGRRESPGRPRARRFGCLKCIGLILRGFGQNKVLLSQPRIAAPRPDAARLVTLNVCV